MATASHLQRVRLEVCLLAGLVGGMVGERGDFVLWTLMRHTGLSEDEAVL